MTEIENIDNQIRVLQRKAFEIRNSQPKPYYDFNNEIQLKFRSERLKISTVEKEVKKVNTKSKSKMAKIKMTFDPKQVTAKKLLVAAGFSGVEILASEMVSPKKTAHTLQFSKGEDLAELGGYLNSLTNEEIDKEIERRDALKKTAEAKKK